MSSKLFTAVFLIIFTIIIGICKVVNFDTTIILVAIAVALMASAIDDSRK